MLLEWILAMGKNYAYPSRKSCSYCSSSVRSEVKLWHFCKNVHFSKQGCI